MQRALCRWFEKIALLGVKARWTGQALTKDGKNLVGSPLANQGHVGTAGVYVRDVVVRPRMVNGRISRPILLQGGAAVVDCYYHQRSRQ